MDGQMKRMAKEWRRKGGRRQTYGRYNIKEMKKGMKTQEKRISRRGYLRIS
jgi:hypothetical protein